MNVKICGIKTIEDAIVAEKAGADFLGFVFTPSSRRVAPVKAAEIAKHLSKKIKKVGVFVNEPIDNMIHIAKCVGLDYIQLHGDEPEAVARQLPLPVIKAFSIKQSTSEMVRTYPCDYLLIDSPGTTYRGGSGKVFDWTKLQKLSIDANKLFLAGGLHSLNIQEAIEATGPAGVDVSSGVETDGKKDHEKIKQFIQHAKTKRKVDLK